MSTTLSKFADKLFLRSYRQNGIAESSVNNSVVPNKANVLHGIS